MKKIVLMLMMAFALAGVHRAHAQTTVAATWTNPAGATFPTSVACLATKPAPAAAAVVYMCVGRTVTTTAATSTASVVVPAVPVVTPPGTATAKHLVTKAGFCLDATNPASVIQSACSASTAQLFDDASKPGQYVQFGLCLNATPNADGTKMTMTTCPTAAQWTVTAGTIKQAAGRCIDMDGSNSAVVGTKAQIWSCDGSNEQQFTVGAAPPPVVVPPPVITPPAGGIPQSAIMSQMNAQIPNAQQQAQQIQVCGGYPVLNQIGDSVGVQCGNGTVNGIPQRFMKVVDPTNPARMVYQHGLNAGDPATAGAPRVDYQYVNGTLTKGVKYWVAGEYMFPALMAAVRDNTTVMAIHTGSNTLPSGNWEYQYDGGLFQIAVTNNAGTNWYPIPQPTFGTFHKIVFEFVLDATGNQGGFINCYQDGVKVWSNTGANSVTATGDFAKSGWYTFQLSSSTPPTSRWMFWRSYYLVKDAGYTLAQVTALQQ